MLVSGRVKAKLWRGLHGVNPTWNSKERLGNKANLRCAKVEQKHWKWHLETFEVFHISWSFFGTNSAKEMYDVRVDIKLYQRMLRDNGYVQPEPRIKRIFPGRPTLSVFSYWSQLLTQQFHLCWIGAFQNSTVPSFHAQTSKLATKSSSPVYHSPPFSSPAPKDVPSLISVT